MTTMSIDELIMCIDRSGLLRPEQLSPVVEQLRSGDPNLLSAEYMARYLVRERLLTTFQARQLLRGRYRGFFLTEKYKILELLGEGGMGRVLLCEHLMLNKLVAVKLLQVAGVRVPGATERFLREARAAAALDHPNIARVYDVDRAGTVPFMVMEYVDGTSLHQLVSDHGPLSVPRAAEYIRQSALGLHHAHENGLIHRDIKPGNLLLDRQGTIKLLDLGLARFFDSGKNDNLTQKFDEKNILGTADFIAPEQAMNSSQVDIRADIYSLGCTFYYLLLRRFPFDQGSAAQKLLWHQTIDPVPIRELRAEVPEELANIAFKMMRKKPEERYQTPREIAEAVAPWAMSVPQPPAHEMPKIRPSAYLLGVSPPPSPSLLSGSRTETPSPAAVDRPTGINTQRSAPQAYPPSRTVMTGGTDVNPALPRSQYASGPMPPPSTPRTGPGYHGHPLPPSGYADAHSGQYPGGMIPTGRYDQPPGGGNKMFLIAAVLGGLLLMVGGGLLVAMIGNFGGNGPADPTTAPSTVPATPVTPSTQPADPPSRPVEYTLRGAGSSFVGPLMELWSRKYLEESGTKVEYKPIGSGGGIKGLIENLQDFGCTDAPMKDSEIAQAKATNGEVIHIPLAMGAVCITYNLPSVDQPLRFTGGQIADIYLGKIKRWNDATLKATNPGVNLPDLPIVPIHRSDSSGTTDIFTDYLTKVSVAWANGPGRGKLLKWPVDVADKVDLGGPQNNGVAEKVSRTHGAIGYVELGYALQNSLPVGEIKNQAGNYVKPDLVSVTAAAAGLMQDLPRDLTFSLTDGKGLSAYPICGTVWAILYLNQTAEKGQHLHEFFRWATSADGQEFCTDLNYAPLPELMRPIIAQRLKPLKP